MDEFALIAELLAPLAKAEPGAFDLTDDAALINLSDGHRLVVTKDMLVAGVHFMADDAPGLVARKLLRVNLSDLAAMGATPKAYLVGLAVPKGTSDDWIRGFAGGLAEDQAAFSITLIGGDTVSTKGPLTLSLTAMGEVPTAMALRRAGAKPGDGVFVSGSIGDGALGLAALKSGLNGADAAYLIGRYHLPRPRLELAVRLRGIAHAAIDVSDGLIADLGHICDVSGVGADIEATQVPLSPAAKAAVATDPALMDRILTGGDDYELLFTADKADIDRISALAADLALPLTMIGQVVAGTGVTVRTSNGEEMEFESIGWQHR
ncbi:MAG: thiamine-phosphate kinase [Alphaproteobacteria bacterium]